MKRGTQGGTIYRRKKNQEFFTGRDERNSDLPPAMLKKVRANKVWGPLKSST